ncbi:MAG: T9SS type A sorting domain-containing protein [Saprospiraceae bacterium]|nr:T9SS type A sorting domain-containing protein [Saprospiraceae bacterium]
MYRRILTIILFLITFSLQSQQWYPIGVNASKLTYEERVNYFEAYWKDKKVTKGKGYKQFLRWAYLERERLLPDGRSQSPLYTYQELQSFDRNNKPSELRNNIPWESLGPNTSEGGYSGIGRVNCLGFHPTDPDTYWAGTPIGGLWKTTDDGKTWNTMTDGLPNLGVSDILVHPQNPEIIYIATGDADGGARDNASIGVLKSVNGGQSWTSVQPKFEMSQGFNIYRMIMNPNDPNHIVLATSDGIYHSSDGLNTAQRTLTGWFCDVEFHPSNPGILYAATFGSQSPDFISRLFISQNGGTLWNLYYTFNDSPSEFSVDRVNIAVTKSRPNGFYTLASHLSQGFHSLSYFEGTNRDWILSGENINLLGWEDSGDPSDPSGQGSYDLSFIVNNPAEMYVGGVISWKINSGIPTVANFWSPFPSQNTVNAPVVHADKHNFHYHPLKPNRLFECNDGGIDYTENGGTTWVNISDGLVISQMYKLSVSQQRPADVMTGLQDNGSKNLENGKWRDVTGGDGMHCIIDPINPNIKYGSYVNGQAIYRTTDNWQTMDNIVENHPEQGKGAWLTPFILHPQNPLTIFIGMTQVWRSDNRGDTWQAISPVLSSDERIENLEISQTNTQVMYAATRTKLFKTSNGGSSWNQIYSTDRTSPITNVKADPLDANKLYLSLGGYVASKHLLVSVNGGSSFQSIASNLPNIPVLDIEIHKETGHMYVGTDLGVFFKTKDEQEWQRYGNLLPNTMVRDIEIAYNEGYLYAATYGRGLWRAPIAQSSAHNFIVNPTSVIFDDAPASCQEISIICGPDDTWDLLYQNFDPSYDILESMTPSSGKGPSTVTVCSNINRLPIDIQGVLSIFPNGGEEGIFVEVNQKGSQNIQLLVYREPNLYSQDSSFIVPYLGGDIHTFILTNSVFDPNTNLLIDIQDKQWLSVKSSNATTFAPFRQIIFEAKQNNGILNRYARVKLIYNNGQDSTFIFINQPSRTAEYLNVNPSEITLFPFEYTTVNNINIQIKTDLSWTAQVTGHDGLNINAQNGKGDRKLTLTLSRNETNDIISGNIIIKAMKSDGVEIERIVKVNQLSFRSKTELSEAFSIFPNPTTGRLILNHDFKEENIGLSIYDRGGKVVYRESILNNREEDKIKELNLENLLPGSYFLRLDTQKSSESKPFIIIK